MENIIQVEGLSKKFKRIVKNSFWKDLLRPEYTLVSAVNNISLEIKQGESVAFLGPNGAGKTTTIKMMTGLIFPSAGKVSVMGYTPFERKRDFLMNIGLVMGNKSGLNWDLTASQSFELLKYIYSIPKEIFYSRIKELSALLDVERLLDIQIRRLSLGERMKMELIGSILHSPKILFLDEPTIGLDSISKQKIRDFLREIQRESGVTMLLTSHDMDDIEKVCDRVIVINKGEKVYDDTLHSLTNRYNEFKFVKLYFENLPDKSEFSISDGVEIHEKKENYYMFKISRSVMSKFISEVTSKFELKDIDIISVPLEDIISDVYRSS
jgi:ABC-2 type transport system ATP-binding protein